MKTCCDRYSFGITIGTIYILASVIFLILNCMLYVKYNKIEDPERSKDLKSEAIESIIICLVTALISSMFIVAIVKRSKYLILPWLILGIYIFFLTCKTMYWWSIGALMGGASRNEFLILTLIIFVAIGSQIAIFCFSCSLYKKIQYEIIEKTGSASDIY